LLKVQPRTPGHATGASPGLDGFVKVKYLRLRAISDSLNRVKGRISRTSGTLHASKPGKP